MLRNTKLTHMQTRSLKSGLLIGLTALSLTVGSVTALAAPAVHTDDGYGPDTCAQGYVWREAFPGDHVCVSPAERNQAAYDNFQAAARVDPYNHAYGPDTCIQGYVWREARPNDHVCVTPGQRAQAAYDNSQASNRLASTEIDPGTTLNSASN